MTDLYIDTPQGLADLCAALRGSPFIAVDTEFLREKTYFPRLCLLQVATDDLVACIDPLALPDLGPLLTLFADPTVTKVLHAAHQDLEIMYALCGTVPAPVFDTQIAATLLGGGDQVGYGALVQAELGVELDKGHTRTDWCQRPLAPEQLLYAADDVRYLCQVYHRQRERLEQMGRIGWLRDDFAELCRPERYMAPPEQAWLRIKGAGRLRGVQLAVLQAVAAWREQEARSSDRPRRWVLKDEVMLDLAKLMPTQMAQLERLRGLDERLLRKGAGPLLALVAEAKRLPREQWPVLSEGPRVAADQEELVDALMAVLRAKAREQHVTPAAIASRRDLELLALGERDLPLLHGWRGALAGEALLAFLDGQLTLHAATGRLVIASA
jgi:ribonuclease D